MDWTPHLPLDPLEGKYLCQVQMASPNPELKKTVVSKSCLYTVYRTFKYARTTVQLILYYYAKKFPSFNLSTC